MSEVILVGGFHEIIELCEEQDLVIRGIIDNKISGFYCGYPIIGSDNDAKGIFNKYRETPLIITPDNPNVREKLVSLYKDVGFKFYSLIGKRAHISKRATIGEGCVIQNGVNISSHVTIGNFVKVNTNANIMHDVSIGDFSTIAPNSVLLGKVDIRKNAYIGANSTILPFLHVGDEALVGAGSIVTKNVEAKKIVMGNPAKELKKNNSFFI
ncbi:NeuD/PglB/VioB family sugar acetyltransferase [Proteiniphilum sp. X52]|uniref:NeuD/PglB/VioB family sugar acetyltransferase n=1 Tax=Proteiniphilum sp. X52 TaxID=2382159 RepID=UPI000F09DD56|nr:NeuD/PglB/VioB family sugar acetyltransferase [Proteiniphilum sp. X52]RNC64746.1 hypothetical protein D7D25_10465 [Proteiniphilum sp. X52]